jgi:septal ring factor EnvC (AmiA/AmiB activator)
MDGLTPRVMHEGLDIRCLQRDKRGEATDPVLATADGTVVYTSTKPALSNYGNYVVLRHQVEGLEIYSLYAHLSAIAPGLKVGQSVKAGQTLSAYEMRSLLQSLDSVDFSVCAHGRPVAIRVSVDELERRFHRT